MNSFQMQHNLKEMLSADLLKWRNMRTFNDFISYVDNQNEDLVFQLIQGVAKLENHYFLNFKCWNWDLGRQVCTTELTEEGQNSVKIIDPPTQTEKEMKKMRNLELSFAQILSNMTYLPCQNLRTFQLLVKQFMLWVVMNTFSCLSGRTRSTSAFIPLC